jgi:D-alanine-D-alanine ligase
MPELVTVLFGGPSPEHDVSILTGLQAERVLSRAGTQVQCIYWARGGQWYLVPANTEARDYLAGAPDKSTALTVSLGANPGVSMKQGLRTKSLDLGTVLNCLHGGAGEGGGAQALFDLLGVPSTGGTMAAAALGMDKLAFGAVMTGAGLPSLTREHLGDVPPTFDGPYIVKPRFGGSSIGIEVVPDHQTALSLLKVSPHLRSGAVVEPYRNDLFDLNISVRTFPEFATSLIERPLRPGDGIYSFTEKYIQTAKCRPRFLMNWPPALHSWPSTSPT